LALEEAKHKKRLERERKQLKREGRVKVRQGAGSSLKSMLTGDSGCEMIDALLFALNSHSGVKADS